MKDLLWMDNDEDFLSGISAVVDMFARQFGYNNNVYIKDIQGRYVYASQQYLEQILGINDSALILGKTDIELNVFPETDFATEDAKEDKEVIRENHLISYLKIYPYHFGAKPLLFNKLTLYNKKTTNVLGVLVRVMDVWVKNLPSKILEINQIKLGSQAIANNVVKYKLTPREQQVVFLFLSNFSSPDIAKIISQIEGKALSKSYIDKVFAEQLYVKFGVNDRKALFDKLQLLGVGETLPDRFLKYGSIRISITPELI